MSIAANPRQLIIRIIFISVAIVIATKLLFLQLFEDKYKVMANDIAIFRKVVYPPRGIIYDRKGKVMCSNQPVYDLMVTPYKITNIDTFGFCQALGIDTATYNKLLLKAIIQNGYRRQGAFILQLTQQQAARFQENMNLYQGYQLIERSIRNYPIPTAANVMGYIGEVSARMLNKDRYMSYRQGDYVGIDGLEYTYEEVLRGQRGVYYLEKDNFNRPRDSYKNGELDTPAIAGQTLELYLDAALQQYGEKLMQNKLGSAVAIDPRTGGIIAMISGPSYDPNLLKGKDRSANYYELYKQATKPLFNRAIKASYPPGSTQKPLTALIALEDGAITPSYGYPCPGAYLACRKAIACTHHGGGHAANLRLALANSCNSYFCHIYRLSVDMKQFGGVKNGLQDWYRHMYSFGMGHPIGVDIPYEVGGTLFDSSDYNNMYNFSWNSCTNLFIGMGQGELTQTPLQMANAMCIIANHGYYYTPHFVKSIGGNPNHSQLQPYLKKNTVTNIKDEYYELVGLGMMDVVDHGTATVAQIPGIEVCAKTGTAENKALIRGAVVKLQNHSMFVAFAPRENPKICVAVAVENAGYGATWGGPIASLLIEKYLNDTISAKRKYLEDRMFNGNVISKYVYVQDSQQRAKDAIRWEAKQERKRYEDSLSRASDSLKARMIIEQYYLGVNN